MTREDVLKEFDPFVALGRIDQLLRIAEAMADEIVRLREQLRDMHTKVFHVEEKATWVERERDQLTSLPAERTLAALREPSAAVIKAGLQQCYGNFPADWDNIYNAIRAAVAAAEQEVGGGT